MAIYRSGPIAGTNLLIFCGIITYFSQVLLVAINNPKYKGYIQLSKDNIGKYAGFLIVLLQLTFQLSLMTICIKLIREVCSNAFCVIKTPKRRDCTTNPNFRNTAGLNGIINDSLNATW